jgi:hypothetical protein
MKAWLLTDGNKKSRIPKRSQDDVYFYRAFEKLEISRMNVVSKSNNYSVQQKIHSWMQVMGP